MLSVLSVNPMIAIAILIVYSIVRLQCKGTGIPQGRDDPVVMKYGKSLYSASSQCDCLGENPVE